MATIHDVAKASGVSVTTVSVVLNNAPRPVNAETRQRVLAAARRLNYHPNAMARGLVSRRTHSLGIQFSSVEPSVVTNYYASGILSGILAEGAMRKYDIHLFTSLWENATVSGSRIKAQRTDGVLAISPVIGSDIASGLEQANLPVVVVSAPSGLPNVPYVDVDNILGARLAVEHLLELGHTRIAYLATDRTMHSEREREAGFLTGMQEAGRSVAPEFVVSTSYVLGDITQSLARLLALPAPPTALFVCNDNIALSLLKAARDLNVSIPGTLSLIGFDDTDLASLSAPALTTIRHPLRDIGATAARLLIERIEGRAVPERHIFTPELVVRASTAPPPHRT
ncbi:MAG: LacI family DNA-binding transcriptional regulator [Capsulimonadales bacterium]|nr:LacI family DNA-binding transcriptional regulator [Capsulimonadales bacterium]